MRQGFSADTVDGVQRPLDRDSWDEGSHRKASLTDGDAE